MRMWQSEVGPAGGHWMGKRLIDGLWVVGRRVARQVDNGMVCGRRIGDGMLAWRSDVGVDGGWLQMGWMLAWLLVIGWAGECLNGGWTMMGGWDTDRQLAVQEVGRETAAGQ